MKPIFRSTAVIIFVVIFLILFLSDREDQYQDEGDKIEAYDSYIVPRIAIASMMVLSSIVSVVFMTFIHFSKVITVWRRYAPTDAAISVTHPLSIYVTCCLSL